MAKAQPKKNAPAPRPNRSQRRAQAQGQPTFPEPSVIVPAPVIVLGPHAAPTASPAPTEEQIRARAYALYVARSGAPGRPEEDWMEAERQLRAG